MKKLFICSFFLLLLTIGFYSCDSTSAPDDLFKDIPTVTSFTVSPDEFIFTLEEGYRDTTITVYVEAQFDRQLSEPLPTVMISRKASGELLYEQPLELINSESQMYGVTIQIPTTTTSIADYSITMIYDHKYGGYAQTILNIRGFPNDPPQVVDAVNPDSVKIPTGDEVVNILFKAKVTDPDGQNNIEGVFIEFINEDGTRLVPNPNELLDNGDNSTSNGSGDEAEGDSIYTIGFSINSSNTPNNRTVQYFAIDKAGLSSDTVETSFKIIE